jgi:thiol-disulfide isomerase/thioredoxin
MRVEPGEPGKVTIVVFWSLDLPVTRAAARHVADLEEKYRGLGVIALGIVEKDTKDSERASQFMLSEGINYPGYYDDFKALRAMGRAAGAKVKKELPCFFLVDREQRVRLFKRGFSFTGWLAKYPRTGDEQVVENAAPGERIEDFLRQLLDER